MSIKRKNRISECCDILDNLRVPINDEIRQTMQGNIPYYGANGIQGYIDKYIFDEDLILLAEDGGNFEEYHTRPIAYKISGKSWVNNHAHILRAKEEFNQDFIFYSIVHKDIAKYLNSGTRSKLNKSELEKIEIDFPETKDEEDKIARILSTCDAVIEKTQAAIAKYKAIKQGMLHDLFTRGIVTEPTTYTDKAGRVVKLSRNQLRPRYEDAPELYIPARLSGGKSKLGWIPKEWEIEIFSNAYEIISGGTPSTQNKDYWNGQIPWLSVEDFNNGKRYVQTAVKKITEEGLKNSATNLLEKGMIIISARGTVGVISQLGAIMAFNQSCYGINSISEKVNNDFAYYFLNYYKNYFGFISFGSVFNTITRDYFDEMEIHFPSNEDELAEIIKRMSLIDSTIEAEQIYLQKMQQLKKGLMEDLLSGRKSLNLDLPDERLNRINSDKQEVENLKNPIIK